MSWWGHTFLPVIQETFEHRSWEANPHRAAEIIAESGQDDVAAAVDRMTPEKWREAAQIAHLLDEDA